MPTHGTYEAQLQKSVLANWGTSWDRIGPREEEAKRNTELEQKILGKGEGLLSSMSESSRVGKEREGTYEGE